MTWLDFCLGKPLFQGGWWGGRGTWLQVEGTIGREVADWLWEQEREGSLEFAQFSSANLLGVSGKRLSLRCFQVWLSCNWRGGCCCFLTGFFLFAFCSFYGQPGVLSSSPRQVSYFISSHISQMRRLDWIWLYKLILYCREAREEFWAGDRQCSSDSAPQLKLALVPLQKDSGLQQKPRT